MLGYIGLVLAIAGTLVLTARMQKFTVTSSAFLLILMVINTGVYEFVIKVATINVPEFQLLAINSVFAGLGVFLLCFKSSVRRHLRESFSLWRWALFIEFLTVIAILFIILPIFPRQLRLLLLHYNRLSYCLVSNYCHERTRIMQKIEYFYQNS
jgi:hypothetical protein